MERLATVLMPVYNAAEFLKEAIDSVLAQSFKDFDFLIINDGSTDESDEIIRSYPDPRITYLNHTPNAGLVSTLNKGLEMINTKYIIRMDADDISLPNRFKVLIDFMELNSGIGVFSSALRRFGNDDQIWKMPIKDGDIKAGLLFGSSITHAPSIIRTEVLKENSLSYSNQYPFMEDYDLWLRLRMFTRFAGTEEILYLYRVLENNATVINSGSLMERKKIIFLKILSELQIVPSEAELLFHIGFGPSSNVFQTKYIKPYYDYLRKLSNANQKTQAFPVKELNSLLKKKWDQLFFQIPVTDKKSLLLYIKTGGFLNFTQSVFLLKSVFNKYIRGEKGAE